MVSISGTANSKKTKVIVTGDVELDWFSYTEPAPKSAGNVFDSEQGRRTAGDGLNIPGWHYYQQHFIFPKLGGAWQQAKSIHCAAASDSLEIDLYEPGFSDLSEANMRKYVKTFYSIKADKPNSLNSDEMRQYEDCAFLSRYKQRFKVDKLLGYNGSPDETKLYDVYFSNTRCPKGMSLRNFGLSDKTAQPTELTDADIVVIDDSGYGFCDRKDQWPQVLSTEPNEEGSGPVIVYRMRNLLAKGELWKDVYAKHRKRVILIIRADDLRSNGITISRRLSHERSAADLCRLFGSHPVLKQFSECAYTIVRFGIDSAMLFYKETDSQEQSCQNARVYFNPNLGEDAYTDAHRGQMLGVGNVFVGSLVKELIVHKADSKQLSLAVKLGVREALLSACRIWRIGYTEDKTEGEKCARYDVCSQAKTCAVSACEHAGECQIADCRENNINYETGSTDRPQIHIPYDLIFSKRRDDVNIAMVDVPGEFLDSIKNNNGIQQKKYEVFTEQWKIFNHVWGPSIEQLAIDCIVKGPDEALASVPVAHFQELRTFDRPEMESYRSIRNLIKEYLNTPQNTKPLSIAVFGAPGSGKSFGIKQIMMDIALAQDKKLEDNQQATDILEFNLSQFTDPRHLIGIFHQVRDATMRSKMPVVFFDEFDSHLGENPYGWLKYFLAPMQDGLFVDDNMPHPIGKAIFVFAGGVFKKFADMPLSTGGEKSGSTEDSKQPSEENPLKVFEAAKGPDFVSRLMGYVDITDLDAPDTQGQNLDRAYMIKRALVIRRHLEKYYRKLFTGSQLNIDGAVLNAFLNVRKFQHGLRSITAILDMSALSERKRFEVSCLPPVRQMNLHVDAEEFFGLIKSYEGFVTAINENQTNELYRLIECWIAGWMYKSDSSKLNQLLEGWASIGDVAAHIGNMDSDERIGAIKPGYTTYCFRGLTSAVNYKSSEPEDFAFYYANYNLLDYICRISTNDGDVRYMDPRCSKDSKCAPNEKQGSCIDSVSRRLSYIGCYIGQMTNDDPMINLEKITKIHDNELGSIGRRDHERWLREMTEAGWKYGVVDDAKEKTNSNMVPWEDLDEGIKSELGLQIRNLPLLLELFKNHDYSIYRYTARKDDNGYPKRPVFKG